MKKNISIKELKSIINEEENTNTSQFEIWFAQEIRSRHDKFEILERKLIMPIIKPDTESGYITYLLPANKYKSGQTVPSEAVEIKII